jgi:Protein of unknown function (DUF1203)
MNSFQLVGLDDAPFAQFFELSDERLAALGAVRKTATQSPGFPCRVSLEDAEVGEQLLLLPYVHQPAASPYRASGPIFIRKGAKTRKLAVGEVPAYVTRRLISIRAYDAAHMMVDAMVCEGARVGEEIARLFGNDVVAYIQLHNARQGCFSCQVNRAQA